VSGGAQLDVRVAAIETMAQDVKCFELVSASGEPLPSFSAGSHVVVTMHGERVFRNPYSLMGPLLENRSYRISVLRTESSRGGSHYMHDAVKVGSPLTISYPINLFPLDQLGRKHLLLAGGIGITPLMAMAEELLLRNKTFELHYCMRTRARGAHLDALGQRLGERFRHYCDDRGETLPLARILERQPLGTHLYCCGPAGMIDAALLAARNAGWTESSLHWERFQAPPGGKPFTVKLARSGLTVSVREQEGILDAVEAAGVDAPYLCRGGACGQCETAVLAADGAIVHNDHYLSAEEHKRGGKIMICVSRFEGRELVLDL